MILTNVILHETLLHIIRETREPAACLAKERQESLAMGESVSGFATGGIQGCVPGKHSEEPCAWREAVCGLESPQAVMS